MTIKVKIRTQRSTGKPASATRQDARTLTLNEREAARAPLEAGMTPHTIDSRDLFRGATEIQIVHDGAIYRMKITRQGKLILNK